jgi:hypothetical protein
MPGVVTIVCESASDNVQGSGFFVRPGVVATNFHVVRGMIRGGIVPTTDPPTETPKWYVAEVLAVDEKADLALLAVPDAVVDHLPVLPLVARVSDILVGQKVFALGSPLGLTGTISEGIVSASLRIEGESSFVQISAPISQGSSGGPLFNQFGEVIGVTTAIITGGQNINLAIPSNYMRPMVASPAQISMQEFARQTKEIAEREGRDDGPRIQRLVPDHALTIFQNCQPEQIAGMVLAIEQAIEVGAPLYNKGEIEACFRIYEGTAVKFERDSKCPGISAAFTDGLSRAKTLDTYKEKAWAMRDTFDGLLNVARKWVRATGKSLPPAVPPAP